MKERQVSERKIGIFAFKKKLYFVLITSNDKVSKHMDGSNADLALHMEERHTDFAQHMEQRHSFRDPIIVKL